MELFAASGLINGVTAAAFGLLVFFKNWRDRANQIFLLMTASLAVWAFGYWRWLSATDYIHAFIWVRILSLGSLFIPIFFYHWVSLTIDEKKIKRWILWIAYPLAIALSLTVRTTFFIQNIEPKSIFPFWPNAGIGYNIYFSYIYVGLILFTLYLLIRAHGDTMTDERKKGQILYILLGGVIGFGGGFSNFPLWWNINILPYGNFLVSAFPFLLGYSVLKFKLFRLKTISTEILVFFLSVILIVQTLIATSVSEFLLRGFFALAVSLLGYLVLKNVYREVAQRHELQKLAGDLEKANERLKELDQAKSEFLSLATHQLRAPITAIKGYASMIGEGDFGPTSPQLKEAVETIMQSGTSMGVMVDDFLNISRIEQGRMKYDFVIADIAVLVQEVVNELRPAIEKKGLLFTYEHDQTQKYDCRVDLGKIKQAIVNLIDNSMKYTPKGWIHVETKRVIEPSARNDQNNKNNEAQQNNQNQKNDAKILIKVSDNGIGIAPENIQKLFVKFSRAGNGISTNVSGTGLGLYVVKEMVKAHGGDVWVESAGEGKGSTFFIKLAAATK